MGAGIGEYVEGKMNIQNIDCAKDLTLGHWFAVDCGGIGLLGEDFDLWIAMEKI